MWPDLKGSETTTILGLEGPGSQGYASSEWLIASQRAWAEQIQKTNEVSRLTQDHSISGLVPGPESHGQAFQVQVTPDSLLHTHHVVTASANTPPRTGTSPCPEEKGLPMLCQKVEHVSDLPEKDLNHQSKRRTQVNVPFSTQQTEEKEAWDACVL